LIRDSLQQIVASAVARLIESGHLPEAVRDVRVEISDTKQPEHGDYACNFAMAASKAAGMNPRQIGEILKEALEESSRNPTTAGGGAGVEVAPIQSVEVAGPGFLNFRLSPAWLASFVPMILELGDNLPSGQGQSATRVAHSQKINVEFVSVNPNGPITIGSGRGAAYGSTLCNVLEAAGHRVHREYYINDGVNSEQMAQFALSVAALLKGEPVPENGYKGDYVQDVAEQLRGSRDPNSVSGLQRLAQEIMLDAQRSALESFGTTFDTWFSEQSLHDSGAVDEELKKMLENGVADDHEVRTKLKLAKGGVIEDVEIEEQAGKAEETDEHDAIPIEESTNRGTDESKTLWLRSTKFGDDMDRVLRRRDGRLTYIASDVAYHKDKLLDESGVRGTGPVDKMITILGPDHHGYIGRLQAVVAAMLKAEGMVPQTAGDPQTFTEIDDKIFASAQERDQCHAALEEAKQKLEVQIFQLVRFLKDGKPAPMRKRDGNIYALIDLVREIGDKVKPNGTEEEKLTAGKDVARFFYLMRSHDTTFDFDLDLAEKQSDENPVFYVQYAHARICSVIAKAEESDLRVTSNPPQTELLTHERELALIKKICDLPFEVRRCAEDYGVHRLTTYAVELARTYHHFYEACRVIQSDQPELSRARLAICLATKNALKSALDLLGVSSPERMERSET
jgi:arginyl-tRNA synthetase